MAVFLLYILLVPLALPPVFSSKGTYEKFVKQHTYDGNTFPDCKEHMNSVLKALNMGCKPCNTIILGDGTYKTALNEVTDVCTKGTNVEGNLYESVQTFRVIKCTLKTAGGQPPNCDYRKLKEENIQKRKITLGCVNQKPVHLVC